MFEEFQSTLKDYIQVGQVLSYLAAFIICRYICWFAQDVTHSLDYPVVLDLKAEAASNYGLRGGSLYGDN